MIATVECVFILLLLGFLANKIYSVATDLAILAIGGIYRHGYNNHIKAFWNLGGFLVGLVWTYIALLWCGVVQAVLIPVLKFHLHPSFNWALWIIAFFIVVQAPVRVAHRWFVMSQKTPDDPEVKLFGSVSIAPAMLN